MKTFDTIKLPEVKLHYKQKIILDALQDEFHGRAFGPQMLDETENPALKELTINEITWHMLRLRESSLVQSEKKTYKGRVLNEYSITPYVSLGVINFK